MDDVTDSVFRQIVADCAKPDLFFTEFVNVDGLQSPGRPKLIHKLSLGPHEGNPGPSRLDARQGAGEQRTEEYTYGTSKEQAQPGTKPGAKSTSGVAGSAGKQAGASEGPVPIIAQLWGLNPQNFYKTTREVIEMGFDGVDLNMGCPVKTVVKNGACAALIKNRELAGEIIAATREAAGDEFPISVKTRVGFSTTDMTWIEFLLGHKLNMLSIHGRTAKQLSKVPADWDLIGQAREIRDSLCPATFIVGNGDVMSRSQAGILAEKHKLNGVMIGRGIFHDPFLFANKSPWAGWSMRQKIELFIKHIELFDKTWRQGQYKFDLLKKFAKVYINGFDGASDLRAKFMESKNAKEAISILGGGGRN